MKHTRIPAAGLALALTAATACRGREPEVTAGSAAGACTVVEPGSAGAAGLAAYAEHVTPTAGGGFGVGSLAVTVTCVIEGPERDLVVLIFPNLRRGEHLPAGEYTVRVPDDGTLTREQRLDPRLAWARVSRGRELPVLYTARAGKVVVARSVEGVLEGAYQLALAAGDSAVVLPGAAPEVAGGTAADSTGRPPLHRTVLAGAFVAPRKEADWRGR
jgi:hypothetical protein